MKMCLVLGCFNWFSRSAARKLCFFLPPWAVTEQLLGWNQAPGILCQPCFRSRRARAVPVLSRAHITPRVLLVLPKAQTAGTAPAQWYCTTFNTALEAALWDEQFSDAPQTEWGGCQSSLVVFSLSSQSWWRLEQGLQWPKRGCAVPVFGGNSYRIERAWPAQGFIYAMPVLSHLETRPSKSTFGLSPHPNSRETSTLVIIFHLQERLWNAGRLSLRSWTKLCSTCHLSSRPFQDGHLYCKVLTEPVSLWK